VATAAVLCGLVPYTALDVADPMAAAVEHAGDGLAWLAPLVTVGATLGLGSGVLVRPAAARISYKCNRRERQGGWEDGGREGGREEGGSQPGGQVPFSARHGDGPRKQSEAEKM
jgi:hypothetical protein